MDKLTHVNALRAAARVAFGVAVLGGCNAAVTEDETAYSESSINAKDPCPSKTDAAPPKPSCENVLASAWPDGGTSFMPDENAPPVSDEVKTCCEEHLTSNDETWNLQYRWSCCNVLDSWNNPNPSISAACTPWGPPVPPKMNKTKAVA